MANRLANALRPAGCSAATGWRSILPNSIELVAGIFGVLKAGGTFVVVNSTTKQEKLTYMLANCRASAIWASDARQAPLVGTADGQVPSLHTAVLAGARRQRHANFSDRAGLTFAAIQEAAIPGGRPARGDRSRPRLPDLHLRQHRRAQRGDVGAQERRLRRFVHHQLPGEHGDDIVMNVLPLSFDYGLYQLLMTFKFGGTLVLERSFTYPAQILKRMEAERVTGFPGVPTIFALLVPMDLSAYDLSALRYITNTAAALPPSHILQLQAKFPRSTLYSMYGLTETKSAPSTCRRSSWQTAGLGGHRHSRHRVSGSRTRPARLGPNEVGELVIQRPHVMQGYWENPEATAAALPHRSRCGERVCYSGDLFRMDEEGFFYFVSRKDDIIKSRGEKVAPKEVETCSMLCPAWPKSP
jgi:long-chain acyl-CoA synthetase